MQGEANMLEMENLEEPDYPKYERVIRQVSLEQQILLDKGYYQLNMNERFSYLKNKTHQLLENIRNRTNLTASPFWCSWLPLHIVESARHKED